jgi:hypothetical protein
MFCTSWIVSVAHRSLSSYRCRIGRQEELGAKRPAPLASEQWKPARPLALAGDNLVMSVV